MTLSSKYVSLSIETSWRYLRTFYLTEHDSAPCNCVNVTGILKYINLTYSIGNDNIHTSTYLTTYRIRNVMSGIDIFKLFPELGRAFEIDLPLESLSHACRCVCNVCNFSTVLW